MRARHAIALFGSLFVLAATPTAATAQQQLRIVNGDPIAAPTVAPWSVFVDAGKTGVCSGTLIDPSRVLTTATCVYDGDKLLAPQVFLAATGVVRNDSGADLSGLQARPVSAIRVHPGYGAARYLLAGRDNVGDQSYAYDLALLTLSSPFAVTAQVAPVALAQSPPRIRSIVSIVGWGLPVFGAEEQFDIARSMSARTTRATLCADGQPSLLCMVSSRMSPCFGDNGAGVVTAARTLVAVHSFQDARCVAGRESGAISTTDGGVVQWLLGRDDPPLAPSARRLPTIDFAGRGDREIVCRAPTWRGATKLRTLFVDRATQRTLKAGASRRFRPRGQDRRRRIYCVSVASNRGGVTESRSRHWVRVGVE